MQIQFCPHILRLCSVCLMLILPLLSTAHAEVFAVVDTEKVLSESAPAKAGEAHLQKVRAALEKALEDRLKTPKGRANAPAVQRAVREGALALEQQMTTEHQAVRQVVQATMEKAVKNWRSKNKKYLAVISKQSLLDSDAAVDVTPAIMREMARQTVTFSDLPPDLPTEQVPTQPAGKKTASQQKR